jgi:hypothetical protein
MRVPLETIREEGERISPHSKFYIWEDMLFEPSLYRGKPTKSYKPVIDTYRVEKALSRFKEAEKIPTVSSILPTSHQPGRSSFKHERCKILDL